MTLNICVIWAWDFDKQRFLRGGLERWTRDAARLARERGLRVVIYQKERSFRQAEVEDGITVVGLPCAAGIYGNVGFARELGKRLRPTEAILYVSQELALNRRFKRTVAVNHGIFWNGDKSIFEKRANALLQRFLLNGLRRVICVDTNYINWCHSELPQRWDWQQKLTYIPNYADTDMFHHCAKEERSSGVPVIVFPRRINGPSIERDGRGLGLLLDAVRLLESEGWLLRIIIAGRGRLGKEVPAFVKAHGMRSEVEVAEFGFDEMPALYQKADLVVIPTLEQEGTSLSAIEAICSGVPTVVSHIGGLCNVVVPGVTGLVCDLTAPSLASQMRKVLANQWSITHAIVHEFRESLSLVRWKNQVWECLRNDLHIGEE